MNSRDLDVITAGDIFVDLVMSGFDCWPTPGTECFAKEFQRDVGGGAAITACGLARLGSRAAVFSVVGQDNGAWIQDRLSGFGVVTSELHFDSAEPTAFSVAISTPQDRTFLSYPGANRFFAEALWVAARGDRLKRTRHVHLGWTPPLHNAIDLFELIQSNRCSLSLDTGWNEPWLKDPSLRELFPRIDIFFPNELEALQITGEKDPLRILNWFEAAGARRVALKLGAEGAALLWDGEIFQARAHAVTPLDTIGAGDAFDAGFLHYWLQGADPFTCLRAANFCGAASTEAFGGVTAFPAAERVHLALRE